MSEAKDWKYFDELRRAGIEARNNAGFRTNSGKRRKPKRWVEQQETQVRESKQDYSKWLETNAPVDDDGNAVEPVQANPDQLPESAGFWAGSSSGPEAELDDSEVSPLISRLKQILSPQEYRIYQLHIEGGSSFAEIGRRLSISRQQAHLVWRRAEIKIQREFKCQ